MLGPIIVFARDSVLLRSWPTPTYAALQDWQRAQNSDSTISDWARELGCPELEIIGARMDQGHFEGVIDTQVGMNASGSW
ncbi:hypothetical protein WG66_008241 [Moniliophthora roreri]|uniref:Uncharacterized protein n=1 Tax=Moniliophthora roreri TaxID=221103 RepID=A0A0W0FQL7_MONRR|nr:hypothetical protein WG66_008241 [Moniliophthora roreri]